MKAVTIKELRDGLTNCSPKELRDLTLRLARFKKDNKELLTYLLYESSDEKAFIAGIKKEIDIKFEEINRKSYYLIKKSVRKILAFTRKNIRYSLNKETEVELLLYFCSKLKKLSPSIHKNTGLQNLYIRLINQIKKKLTSLHEDLQFDYGLELKELIGFKEGI
jgi:hypothetical protein